MTSKQQFTTLLQGNAASGMQRINRRIEQLESLEVSLNNYSATAAPTVNDDINDGYSVGSFWFDVTNDLGYYCLDATAGAAVWSQFFSDADKTKLDAIGLGARVYNSSSISLTSGVVTTLTFNSERQDDDNYHSTVSNTSRLTVSRDGWYAIGGHVQIDSNATGYRQLFIRLNGSTPIGGIRIPAVSSGAMVLSINTLYYMTAGQYVILTALQNSGVTLNITTPSNYSPEFTIYRVS